jgi:hypothetical protein
MTRGPIMEQEKNWADFYNSLTNIRDKKEEKEGFITIDVNDRDEFFNKLLEKVLRLGDKIGDRGDHSSIFIQGKDKKFDHDNYFSLIWLVRLLNTEQRKNFNTVMEESVEKGKSGVDKKIFQQYLDKRRRLENWDRNKPLPDFVVKFWIWWYNIGNDIEESYIGDMDGFGNELIHDPNIPNLIKIHILSRFIMKRNAAMKGPKNFEINSEIVNDSRNAVSLSENFLRRESNNSSENTSYFHGNKFFSANGVKCLFEIEKLLLIVRSEKDINHIIKEASNTLGTALIVENRVWSAITCYWCNHILWRCSVCKGDIKIAEMFETTCKEIIDEYLPKVPDLQLKLSGIYSDGMRFESYKKGIAHKHWDLIKVIATNEKEPKYQKTITQKYFNGLNQEETGKDDPDKKELEELKGEKKRINKEIKNLKSGQMGRMVKEISELGSKRLEVQKKIDDILGDDVNDILFENRVEFYENYIGLEKEKMEMKINDGREVGRPKLLFSTQDRDKKINSFKKLEDEIKSLKSSLNSIKAKNKTELVKICEEHKIGVEFKVFLEAHPAAEHNEEEVVEELIVRLKEKLEQKGKELKEFLSSNKPHTIWEEKIQFIPDFLSETLKYLKESPSIVSIPTARLVIFDVLLLFSRITVSINQKIETKQTIKRDDLKEIQRKWLIVKKSLKEINNTLRWSENYFEIITGKGKLNDLEKIIKKIEEIHKGKMASKKKFGIVTEKIDSQLIDEKNREVNNSYSAGESIKELLKELIDTDKLELYFPIKS